MLDVQPVGNEEIADWLEIAVIANGSKGNTLHKLEQWASELCQLSQVQVSSGLSVMLRRSKVLGDNYPFEINDYAVVFNEKKLISPYIYLLSITRPTYQAMWQNPSPTQEDSDLFESFVSVVMHGFLGVNGKALPFGWPSKVGRPQDFNGAIVWLAEKMGIEPGAAFRPPRRKDGGVDVVAWKSFNDRRTGFPIYLIQCTLQKEYVSKSRDIDLRLWSGWLELDRDPVTVLAVPRTIPAGEQWNEVSANSILMERIRLCEYAGSTLNLENAQHLERVIEMWQKEGENHLA
jgi:hypothetical protein